MMDKDGDFLQTRSPSRLTSEPRKKRHPLSWLLASLLVLALAALMVFFLWLAFSALRHGTAGNERPEEPVSEPSVSTGTDLALAQAQAQAFAQAAESDLPATLEDVEGVTVDLIPRNEYSRPGVPLDGIHAIVIHYVGNPGTTAQQNRDYFASLAETGEESVSSHFVIGMDGIIIQCIPLDEKSYCSNHRNSDTISIECCHPDAEGAFTQETQNALISLVRYLVDAYDLDDDSVIRHYDVTGKLCPKYYVEHEDAWIALKDAIFKASES